VNPYNKNADIERYNRLIVPLLEEKGIIINNLYQLVASDIDKYIRKDDNIHLTEEGIKICAEQVAEVIRKVSESLHQESENKTDVFIKDIKTTGAPV